MASPPARPLPIADPDEVRLALGELQDRDRQIIELRYGLAGGEPRSRAEIGQMLGISRERVRQLEARALDRLGAHGGNGQARGAPPPARVRRGTAGGAPAPPRQSFLRNWTLLLLWLRPAHVYELRGRLRELGLPPATYRLLQSLEREGYLTSAWEPGRGAGPSRRVYSLAPRGVKELREQVDGLRNMAETLSLFLAHDEFRPSGAAAAQREPIAKRS